MINQKQAKRYCCEDISKIENYDKAVADNTQTWDLHHLKEIEENKTAEQLIKERLYYHRPAAELSFLTKSEHMRMHMQGEKNPNFGKHLSDETLEKMRKAISEAVRGEKHPMFGKRHSAEAREKISKARRGRHWWNNGQTSRFSKECPGPEWQKGRLCSH